MQNIWLIHVDRSRTSGLKALYFKVHTDAFLKFSRLSNVHGQIFAHALSVQIVLAVAVQEMKPLYFAKAWFPSTESQLIITNANVRVRCNG